MPDTAVASPLAFVNHALALIGEDPLTDLIATSGSTNAAAATVYDRVVESLLSKWTWKFATMDCELSEIVAAPPDPWVAQYNLPARTLRIVGTDQPGEAYTIARNHDVADDDGTRRLYAMRSGVRARVLIRPLDELFPAHFISALIPDLTAQLAPAVTGNLQTAQYFAGLARIALSEAKIHDAHETPPSRYVESDPRRGGSGSSRSLMPANLNWND